VSFIPDFYCASAVLSFWDLALKTAVFIWVIFGFHGQVFLVTFRYSFRNSPTFEDTIFFQSQVVVEPSCMVFLNDKDLFFLLLFYGGFGFRVSSNGALKRIQKADSSRQFPFFLTIWPSTLTAFIIP
jgi:hypothetical protein